MTKKLIQHVLAGCEVSSSAIRISDDHTSLDQRPEGEPGQGRGQGWSGQRQHDQRAQEEATIRPGHLHDGRRHEVEVHDAGELSLSSSATLYPLSSSWSFSLSFPC